MSRLSGWITIGALLVAASAAVLRASAPEQVPEQVSSARVELGRRLFYDADLSINGTMSCATCHEQHRAFAEGNRTHPGALDDPGLRNVPGLANVGAFPVLTWADPRQTDLEKQVDVPMLGEHPVEMAMKGHEAEIARRLGRDPCYVTMFRKAFPQERGIIDYRHVAQALAAFERTLVSRDTAWDRWQAGDTGALPEAARQGAVLFARQCASCHAGRNFSDMRFHRIATPQNAQARAQEGGQADAGLAQVTGRMEDEGAFRTAPLRNVALTGPYLHDGSARDIPAAIRAHAGLETMAEPEMSRLVAFLNGLTDRTMMTDPHLSLPTEACGKRL